MTNKVLEFTKKYKIWIIVGITLLIFTIILIVISRGKSKGGCDTNSNCSSDEYCFLNKCSKKCKDGDCDPGYKCDSEKGCVGGKCQIDADCGGLGYYCIDGNCIGQAPPDPPEPLPDCGKPPKAIGLSVNNIIYNFLRTGIDPSKLIVGLPAYGRSIGPVLSDKDNGLLQPFGSPGTGPPSEGRNGIFKYIELVKGIIPGLNLTLQEAKDKNYYHTDPIAKVPYIYIPKTDISQYTDEVSGGGLFMSTVDADCIAEKAKFVKKNGLGGVLFWDMSGDDENDTLLTSASTILKAGSTIPSKIIGYYPQWGPYPGGNYFFVNPPEICPSGITCRFISDNALKNYTHINYAFFSVSYDRTHNSFYIDTLDPWADFGIPYKDQKAQDWPKDNTCIAPELGSKNCPVWKPNKVFKEDWTCWNAQNAGDDSNIRLCQTGGTTVCPPNTDPLANSLYCNLTSKGTTKPQFRGNIGALKQLRARATALGNRDLKIMMSVGGWYDSAYFTLATNKKYRQQFVKSIVSWVTAFDFDGVDIDWEYPTEEHCKQLIPSNFTVNKVPKVCQVAEATSDTVIDCMACGEGDKSACQYPERMNDPENYLAFFEELRKQLNAVGGKKYVISVAAPAFPSYVDRIDIKRLGDFIDFLNIMLYDINGAFNDPPLTNFNAPLYNICTKDSDCLNYSSNNINITSKCWEKQCVECNEDTDCKTNTHGNKCDTVNHVCY